MNDRLLIAGSGFAGTWAAIVGLLAAYRAQGGAIVTATHDQAVIDRAHQVHHLDGQPREAPGTHGRPWLSGRNPLALLAGAATSCFGDGSKKEGSWRCLKNLSATDGNSA